MARCHAGQAKQGLQFDGTRGLRNPASQARREHRRRTRRGRRRWQDAPSPAFARAGLAVSSHLPDRRPSGVFRAARADTPTGGLRLRHAVFRPGRQDRRQQARRIGDQPAFRLDVLPADGAKAPLPVRIAPAKPADCVRIFIFGGSAAMGSPDAAYSFGRVLEVMLAERYPARKFQVVVTAMEGMNSHVARVIADEAVDLHPDLFLVYMGNNEVVGPFGASDVFRGYTPSVRTVRASLWLKSTRTGQLVGRIIDSVTGRGKQVWMGMESFAGAGVRADDPRLKTTCDNFAANLAAIREDAARAGAKSIVCTVASNLRDCPPFISSHKPGLGKDDNRTLRRALRRRTQTGRRQPVRRRHGQLQTGRSDRRRLGQSRILDGPMLPGGRAGRRRPQAPDAVPAISTRSASAPTRGSTRRSAGPAKQYDGFVDFEKIAAADPLSRDRSARVRAAAGPRALQLRRQLSPGCGRAAGGRSVCWPTGWASRPPPPRRRWMTRASGTWRSSWQ